MSGDTTAHEAAVATFCDAWEAAGLPYTIAATADAARDGEAPGMRRRKLTLTQLRAVLDENARMREERPLLGPTYANGWADALRAVRMPGLHEREAAWRKFREVVIDAAPQQTARDAANGDAECECGCRPGQTCTCSVHDCDCIGDCPVCDADETEHAPGGEVL